MAVQGQLFQLEEARISPAYGQAKGKLAPWFSNLTDDEVIERAIKILELRIEQQPLLSSPIAVRQYLQLKLSELEHEVFAVLYLNAQTTLIAYEELFRGTLTQTSVYPREVVKRCLAQNAASVIIAHNHPSGVLEPSRADEKLTTTLKSSLSLVDIQVLDHIIVSRAGTLSFAERGLL